MIKKEHRISDLRTDHDLNHNQIAEILNVKNNTYFTTNARDTSFTLWTESDYCKNNACPISREDGIGPSWK